MSANSYTFESANLGDITIRVDGRWRDGRENAADLTVEIGGSFEIREFDEVYYGSADEVFEWLCDRGVEFASPRSMLFNIQYVDEVMIDRSMTEEQLLDYAARWEDASIERGIAYLPFEPSFAPEEGR